MIKISIASAKSVSVQSLNSSERNTPKVIVTIAVRLTIRVIARSTKKIISPYKSNNGW